MAWLTSGGQLSQPTISIKYYASYLNLVHHRAVRAERKQCPDTVTASVLPPPPRKHGSGAEGEPPLGK